MSNKNNDSSVPEVCAISALSVAFIICIVWIFAILF